MPTTTAMTLAARRRVAIVVVIVIFARPSSRLLRGWGRWRSRKSQFSLHDDEFML
jgi:hypothetical protein